MRRPSPFLTAGAAVTLAVVLQASSASAAAGVPGCDVLTAQAGAAGSVVATVPASLGLVDVPASAFSVMRDGVAVPVAAARRDPSTLTVVVVLAAAADASAEARAQSLAAARDFLQEVPQPARVGVVSAVGSPVVLSAPTQGSGAGLRSLQSFGSRASGPDSTLAAVQLAAQQVSPGSRGQVIVISAGGSAELPDVPAGTDVHQLGVAAGSSRPDACPSPRSTASLLESADAVAARLTGEYDVTLPPGAVAPAQLRLDYRGLDTAAPLPGATPGAPAPAASRTPSSGASGSSHLGRVLEVVLVALVLVVVVLGLAFLLRSRRAGHGSSMISALATAPLAPQPVERTRRAPVLPRSSTVATAPPRVTDPAPPSADDADGGAAVDRGVTEPAAVPKARPVVAPPVSRAPSDAPTPRAPRPAPAPVEAAPVEAAPVEAAPIEVAPIEAANRSRQARSWARRAARKALPSDASATQAGELLDNTDQGAPADREPDALQDAPNVTVPRPPRPSPARSRRSTTAGPDLSRVRLPHAAGVPTSEAAARPAPAAARGGHGVPQPPRNMPERRQRLSRVQVPSAARSPLAPAATTRAMRLAERARVSAAGEDGAPTSPDKPSDLRGQQSGPEQGTAHEFPVEPQAEQ